MAAQAAMAGGSFALSMYTSGLAAKAKQQEDIRNAKLAQQKRSIDTSRETQAFLKNRNDLARQNTSDNFNTDVAGMQAQSEAVAAMAGSGISGASVNELSSEINREVAKDKIAANRTFRDTSESMQMDLKARNENRIWEAENAYVHDYTQDIKADMFRSVGSSMEIYSRGIK